MQRLLVIGGSDSSGGAGIQADLKTAQAFGVYAQTVLTAVTAQDTNGVRENYSLAPELVCAQIDAALDDIGADAIKVGMLGNGAIAALVADRLETRAKHVPLVVDPVIQSTSGAVLLDEEGVEILKRRLFRIASVITPNAPESEMLVGIRAKSDHSTRNSAMAFSLLGPMHVLFKGGHIPPREGDDGIVRDTLFGDGKLVYFDAPRQNAPHTHGTGCTLATAIACGLAQGMKLELAVRRAHGYVQDAIRSAPGLGGGNGPLHHKPL